MFIESPKLDLEFAFGSGFDDEYATDHNKTSGGNWYSALRHPYPVFKMDMSFNNRDQATAISEVYDIYMQVGTDTGFRFKNWHDYSSNGYKGTPAFSDQACVASGSSYQITKWYGTESESTAKRRRLRKPVDGSVLVGIRDAGGNDVQITQTGVSPLRWIVDTTTGLITFSGNTSYTITNITQAAQAVVTIGTHSLVAGDTVHFSGVGGMTEVNGLRGTIQSVGASTITVNINTTGFTAWSTSSPNTALVNTAPQTGETVTAGCYFDLPVKFTSVIDWDYSTRNTSDVILTFAANIEEWLNPA